MMWLLLIGLAHAEDPPAPATSTPSPVAAETTATPDAPTPSAEPAEPEAPAPPAPAVVMEPGPSAALPIPQVAPVGTVDAPLPPSPQTAPAPVQAAPAPHTAHPPPSTPAPAHSTPPPAAPSRPATPVAPHPLGPLPAVDFEASPTPPPATPAEEPAVVQRIEGGIPPLPQVKVRGLWSGFWLAVLTAIFLGLARGLTRLRSRLLATGLLPGMAIVGSNALRLGAMYTAFRALGAIIPETLAPALPFVLLGAALAVGWSMRDLLPDLVAGLALSLERRALMGQWIEGDGFAGVVEHVGIRATWIRERDGRRVVVPHRALMLGAVADDTGRYPVAESIVQVPPEWSAAYARDVITELSITSPWIAPRTRPELRRDTDLPGRWFVRDRLLEGRFANSHAASLRDRLAALQQAEFATHETSA